jgi:hypothetical protein
VKSSLKDVKFEKKFGSVNNNNNRVKSILKDIKFENRFGSINTVKFNLPTASPVAFKSPVSGKYLPRHFLILIILPRHHA